MSIWMGGASSVLPGAGDSMKPWGQLTPELARDGDKLIRMVAGL